VDAFLRAQGGIIQPQLITIAKVKDTMKELSLRIEPPTFPLRRIFMPYHPYNLLQTNLFSVYTSGPLITVHHVPII
jgi:hypothetical protein